VSLEASKRVSAAPGRPAGLEQEAQSPPANDNVGSRNPTVVDLPGEISDECRSKFAKVLARILVARALIDLGIQPSVDEDCPAASEDSAEEGKAKR
jgi:hypothetical protein